MKKERSSARTMALLAYISVLVFSMFACDDQDGRSANSGKLRLSLAADTTSLKKAVNSGMTKAVSDEFEKFLTTEDYQIRIVTDKDTVKSYDRFDQMPSEIELPEGAYTLIASKGDNLPAEFENPYFEGSTAFTIKEDMSTPLDVTCSLGNARVTVDCTDDFKEAYSDYTTLLSSSYATTEFEIAKGETRPAYMQVAKEGTNIAIGIRVKKITEEKEKTYYVPTPLKLERRQNVRLVFKTDGEALEGIGLTIMLEDSLIEKTFTTKIPDYMWKPFDKPTLIPDGFNDGDEVTIKISAFNEDLSIGFGMPAGIGSLIIKQWVGDDEDDAECIDLVTDAELAKEKNFSWMVENEENPALKDVRKTGYLNLKNAIKSLKAPEEGSLTYHYKFYGTDATGKQYATNEVNLTVIVQAANEPFIKDFVLPSEIVEGDALDAAVSTKLMAEAGIDVDKTVLTIHSENGMSQSYALMNESDKSALSAVGIIIESSTTTALDITFNKNFTTFLSAPGEGGSKTYTLKMHLEDAHGKSQEISKIITVKAPEFELLTDSGDAFAKRIILRSNLLIGNKSNLCFQYTQGTGNWVDVSPMNLKTGGDTQWVDTLRTLEPDTEYKVRVVYNKGSIYERVSEAKTLKTEIIEILPNADFEEDWNSRTISGLINGANIIAGKVSLTANTPKGWSAVNDKTFSGKKTTYGTVLSTYNSVPSTMKDEGVTGAAVRLRTVGWDNSAGNTVTICYHAAAGKLFLGGYSFDHDNNKDTYNYGIPFKSRPSLVKAHYKYVPCKGDSFKVWAVVLNREDNAETVLGYGELINGTNMSNWTEQSFKINYSNTAKKATHMYIVFSSSMECSDDESTETNNLKSYLNLGTETDGYTHHEGSNLYIDNVELIYE